MKVKTFSGTLSEQISISILDISFEFEHQNPAKILFTKPRKV